MASELVKGEIKIIMEALTEQLSTIIQYEEKIPQIEIDIVLANVRKLYERLNDLNRLNLKPDVVNEEKPLQHETEIIEAHVQKEEKEEPVIMPELFGVAAEAEKEIPAEKPEKKVAVDEKPNITTEKKTLVPEIQKKPKTDKSKTADLFSISDKEMVADKFKDTPKSLHEKISGDKTDKTVAEKIGKSSIQNLKGAIGINDKFLFINQLFKGDLQEYNKAIDKLNTCSTIENATIILDELKTAHNWNVDEEAYQKMEDLVIRKLL